MLRPFLPYTHELLSLSCYMNRVLQQVSARITIPVRLPLRTILFPPLVLCYSSAVAPSSGFFRECHQVANTPSTIAIPNTYASLVLAFAALDRPLPLPPLAFPFGGPVMNVGPTLLDMYHNKERTTPRGRCEKRDFVSPLARGRSVSPQIFEGAGSADRRTQGCAVVGSQATLPYLHPKSQCDDLSPEL